MKKLLLIAYFFPPANFVGAQRTAYWAENLHKYGYYPIVITRQWNENQTTLTEKQDKNELVVEKHEGYEVHRLPYIETLRDKLDQKGKFKYLQKALTLKEIIASNFLISALPYANFYKYSKEIIKSDAEIKFVVSSGRPFQSFAIGHQLKEDFPYLHWIPDYRDEWTRNTDRLEVVSNSFLSWLDRKSEVDWTSNASIFLTVSQNLKSSLSKYIRPKGEVVENGIEFLSEDMELNANSMSKDIHLCYAGTVYQDQDFSIINDCVFHESLRFSIVGGSQNNTLKNTEFLPRISRQELQKFYEDVDVLVVTPYKELPSCLPVKLFDYFQTGKPILLCPSDKDVMEEFIRKTNSGYIANTVEECTEILQTLLDKKKAGESIALDRNMEEAYFYSREYQTKKLAEILDGL